MRSRLIMGKMRHLGGWRPDKPDHRDIALDVSPGVSLPTRDIHLQAALPTYLPFDQETIGSCTANMGCAQMGFCAGRQGLQEIFSRLDLYANTRNGIEGVPLSEDSGAEIRDVMKALAKFGVCLEATWPYDPCDTRFSLDPSADAKTEARQHLALMYVRCASLHSLKASIALAGSPVGFGFTVYESMMSDDVAQSGLVPYPQPNESVEGGHAVLAVGYDDAQQIGTEVGAVLCLNSWGPSWGQKGFFWLPYRYFNEQLANDMWSLRRAEV